MPGGRRQRPCDDAGRRCVAQRHEVLVGYRVGGGHDRGGCAGPGGRGLLRAGDRDDDEEHAGHHEREHEPAARVSSGCRLAHVSPASRRRPSGEWSLFGCSPRVVAHGASARPPHPPVVRGIGPGQEALERRIPWAIHARAGDRAHSGGGAPRGVRIPRRGAGRHARGGGDARLGRPGGTDRVDGWRSCAAWTSSARSEWSSCPRRRSEKRVAVDEGKLSVSQTDDIPPVPVAARCHRPHPARDRSPRGGVVTPAVGRTRLLRPREPRRSRCGASSSRP